MGNYFVIYKSNDGEWLLVDHEFVTRASAERYIRQHDQNTEWRLLRHIPFGVTNAK